MTPDATGKSGLNWRLKEAQTDWDGPTSSKGPLRVYIGMTSRSLDARRREHENLAHRKESTCPVHKAMRKLGKSHKWHLVTWEKLTNTTYDEARAHEKKLNEKLRNKAKYDRLQVLNRRTLSC